ncbi:hypothetical protein JAAARDRAFT_649738 [Jaapia argillacea MUCL 33604]|uniref:Uncharacterized protein n=1 Tax=Jaapia argillacea MUCL 33604 TaxID=933084 RepID=A0A067Q8S6_9AGAM|nr:hypothetical protein JAAARDRAFT_649738 [Jaapia argillacea MUCL 33604]
MSSNVLQALLFPSEKQHKRQLVTAYGDKIPSPTSPSPVALPNPAPGRQVAVGLTLNIPRWFSSRTKFEDESSKTGHPTPPQDVAIDAESTSMSTSILSDNTLSSFYNSGGTPTPIRSPRLSTPDAIEDTPILPDQSSAITIPSLEGSLPTSPIHDDDPSDGNNGLKTLYSQCPL